MRIRQRAYFAVKSDRLAPDELTVRIGLAPDEHTVRATRIADPPRPAMHAWMIRCDRPVRVDEQIAELLQRLAPVRTALTTLLAERAGPDPPSARRCRPCAATCNSGTGRVACS